MLPWHPSVMQETQWSLVNVHKHDVLLKHWSQRKIVIVKKITRHVYGRTWFAMTLVSVSKRNLFFPAWNFSPHELSGLRWDKLKSASPYLITCLQYTNPVGLHCSKKKKVNVLKRIAGKIWILCQKMFCMTLAKKLFWACRARGWGHFDVQVCLCFYQFLIICVFFGVSGIWSGMLKAKAQFLNKCTHCSNFLVLKEWAQI